MSTGEDFSTVRSVLLTPRVAGIRQFDAAQDALDRLEAAELQRQQATALRDEHFRKHTAFRISSIRRVLECHALGAEVMARKDQKYERLEALHALEALHFIEKKLISLGEIPNTAEPGSI
jgi:hypothetical protein